MMLSNAYAEERGKAPVSSYAHALVAGALLDRHLEEQRLFFPVGILGFPESRRYRLEKYRPDDGSESPFLTLNCLDQDLSFALIYPRSLGLDYRVPVNDEMLDALSAAFGGTPFGTAHRHTSRAYRRYQRQPSGPVGDKLGFLPRVAARG